MKPSGSAVRHAVAYEFGPFRLEPANRALLRGDELVPLTPKAFDTLLVLVERPGQVVGKQELLAAVWADTFVEEATLTQNIYTLRKTLGDGGDQPFIETVPRLGYRFVAEVETDEGEERESARGALRSIAVLPFRTLGASQDPALFGMGMTDALITRLSGLRQLTVRPTSAIIAYAGSGEDPRSLGRRLAVDAVLEGTVQQSGERLRVTIQLVSVDDGVFVFGETFDAIYRDIFSVQDAISQQVADALELRLTRNEQERLTRPPTVDPESYDAYIRGRYHWNKRTGESLERAISCFERAVELDATSARAYAGLADSYVLLPLYGDTPPAQAFPRAREAADRAIELDPDLAEAHTSRAYTRFVYDWQWRAAEEGFERALSFNANYATAHHWYGFLLAALDRKEEALHHATRAHELDPLSLVIGADLAFVHYFARRFEAAAECFRETLELDPAFAYGRFGLALALVALGRPEDAVREAGDAVLLTGRRSVMLAALAFAFARAGRAEEAREILEEIRRQGEVRRIKASRRALALAGLGDAEATLDELETACDQRSRFVAFLGVWPVFDELREHPRFRRLLERVGLTGSR